MLSAPELSIYYYICLLEAVIIGRQSRLIGISAPRIRVHASNGSIDWSLEWAKRDEDGFHAGNAGIYRASSLIHVNCIIAQYFDSRCSSVITIVLDDAALEADVS